MNQEVAQILDAKPEVTPEPAPAEPAPPASAKPDDRVSSKLEILIRREQAAIHRERSAKAKEAELEEKLKRIAEFEGAKTTPKKALELLGLDYNELTQSMLKDGEVPPEVEIRKLREELEQYKTSQKAERDGQLEAQKKAQAMHEQKAVSDFKSEISSYVNEHKARYELTIFEGADELVYDLIDEHYNRTIDPQTGIGKVMPIAEAADKVEAHLEKKEQRRKEVGKVKTIWTMLPKDVQQKITKPDTKSSQPPKTLTNNLSANTSKPRFKPLTDEERVQKAIAYARGLRPDIA